MGGEDFFCKSCLPLGKGGRLFQVCPFHLLSVHFVGHGCKEQNHRVRFHLASFRLTFITLWANLADEKLIIFVFFLFFFFSENRT